MPPTSDPNAQVQSGTSSPSSERVKRTRNRIPQSCQACRKRKLKCDRQHPACENCIKRDDEESCIYIEAPEDEKTRALRARLEYLEAQVREISLSLATSEAPSSKESPEEAEISLTDQFSKLRVRRRDDRALYYGPNCRYGIVTEFPELHRKNWEGKCEFKREAHKLKQRKDEDDSIVSGFPFNVVSVDSSVVALLPEKTLCDHLIQRYFDCCNSIFTVIDFDTYCESYSLIWSTTSSPPKSLLALTFLMVAIAARSLNPSSELLPLLSSEGQRGSLKTAKRWKSYGQLVLSECNLFRMSSLSNIQGLLLLSSLEDVDHARWNLLGLLCNMARISGLHRDPDTFKELDEKVRNLRRRLWSYIFILDQIGNLPIGPTNEPESVHFGYPQTISEGTYDCEPLEIPSDGIPDANNTFLYWMFKFHAAFASSFPGVLGLHKSIAAVKQTDQKIRRLLADLPPELALPPDYIPAAGETPIEILRRYYFAVVTQGHFVTLHRPYRSISEYSKDVSLESSWLLASYQSQIMSLKNILEPYDWFIEEFVDTHIVRGVALLGGTLTREPDHPCAATIVKAVQTSLVETKARASRKRDQGKAHGIFLAIQAALEEKQLVPSVLVPSPHTHSESSENSGEGWGMEDILIEPQFRWDEYLVDMVLDSNAQDEI